MKPMRPKNLGSYALAAMLGTAVYFAALAPSFGQETDSVVSAYQRLVGPGQTLSDRTASAGYLLREGSDDAAQALNSALAAGQEAEVWRAVLLAIASGAGDPPDEMALPVLSLMMRVDDGLLDEWADAMGRFDSEKWRKELTKTALSANKPEDERARAVAALGRYREKVVAKTLMELTGSSSPEVKQAAYDALATLTGITSFNTDASKWARWYREARGFNDARWQRHLVENFTRRASEGKARQQQLEDRLLDAQRALYRTTSPDDRSAVLAYMLGDPLLPIRELGMDLVQQRLVEDQPFDEPLRQAMRDRLEDTSPVIRQRAALRLRDLADEPAADLVARRLADGKEKITPVLRAELLLMAAIPRATAADAALGMLAKSELRADAAGALASMHAAELLTRKQADRARRELRRTADPSGVPAPQEIALFAAIGDDDDWNRIAGWVDSTDPAIKEAAATAWAASDRSLKLLAERAGDPVIQPIVITAAIERGDDPWTLLSLTAHRPEQAQAAEQWERALVSMAGRVQPDPVLKSTDALAKRGESETLLDAMFTATIERYEDQETKPSGWQLLLLRRAEVRMKQQNASLAVADLERLTGQNTGLNAVQREQRDRMIINAYLLTGDDDKAFTALLGLLGNGNAQLRPGATDDPIVERFIDAAERNAKADQADKALAMLNRLRDVMGPRMSPNVANRIAGLRTQLERDTFADGPTENKP